MSAKNQPSGWVGWIGFASFMLLLAGVFALLAGFVALFKDTVIYNSYNNNAWVLDYNQWGWIHIAAGVLSIIAAGSLMAGHMFGRVYAVLIALLSAFANMAFVPIYPIWSIMIIVIDLLIIYAVTVHGSEMRE